MTTGEAKQHTGIAVKTYHSSHEISQPIVLNVEDVLMYT